MVTFLVVLLMVYTFRNLLGLLESAIMLQTSTLEINRRIAYNLNVMRQSACLVFNPILVDNYAASFDCTDVGGSGIRLYDGRDLKLFILVGWGRRFLSVAWPTEVQLVFFFCSGVSKLFGAQGSPLSDSLLNL